MRNHVFLNVGGLPFCKDFNQEINGKDSAEGLGGNEYNLACDFKEDEPISRLVQQHLH